MTIKEKITYDILVKADKVIKSEVGGDKTYFKGLDKEKFNKVFAIELNSLWLIITFSSLISIIFFIKVIKFIKKRKQLNKPQ